MTASVQPPLVGFNNNLSYRGMSFHIQTEDSGVGRPHIITHLFVDGGRVIKTLRVDYSEHVNSSDYRTVVQRLMREQHRAMANDLRKGRVDAIIEGLMPRQTPPGTEAAMRSSPAPAVAGESAEHDEKLRPRAGGHPAANRTTARGGPKLSIAFAALPPDSLDDLILSYILSSVARPPE